jgi:nicotinamidase-related amidase
MTKALVVIDVQKAMFEIPGFNLLDGDGVVERIAGLIARARENGTPIFFVQHDGGPDSPFHPGKPGFPFHDSLAPRPDDSVTLKHRGSAFNRTDFDEKLRAAGIGTLVVCGMQSEFCVDSAVRGAAERGYQVVLVADGHTTGDTRVLKAADIVAHENETLSDGYARILPAAEVDFGR